MKNRSFLRNLNNKLECTFCKEKDCLARNCTNQEKVYIYNGCVRHIFRCKKAKKVRNKKHKDSDFILVEAETLSFEDEFMKFEPRTKRERLTKEWISEAITKGVKNFYRPVSNPYYSNAGRKGICFVPRNNTAIDETYDWWENAAKRYCPERNSRLGTRLEYCAFLGVLIKKIVESGKSVELAWNLVCDDSYVFELFHFRYDSGYPETDGSIKICDFIVGKTFWLLAKEEEEFLCQAGAGCLGNALFPTPADIWASKDRGEHLRHSIGWVVLEK